MTLPSAAIALLLEIPVLSVSFGLTARAWGLPAICLASAMLLFFVSLGALGMRRRLEGEPSEGAGEAAQVTELQ